MKTLLVGASMAGMTLFAVGAIFHVLVPVLASEVAVEYAANDVFRPWPGWTRIFMLIYPFAYGFAFAAAYDLVRSSIDRFCGAAGGCRFGLLMAIGGATPIYLLCFAAVRLPANVVVAWVVQTIVQYLAAGAVLGVMRSRF